MNSNLGTIDGSGTKAFTESTCIHGLLGNHMSDHSDKKAFTEP